MLCPHRCAPWRWACAEALGRRGTRRRAGWLASCMRRQSAGVAGAGAAVADQLNGGVVHADAAAVGGERVQHRGGVGVGRQVDVGAQQGDAGGEGPHMQVVNLLHAGHLRGPGGGAGGGESEG